MPAAFTHPSFVTPPPPRICTHVAPLSRWDIVIQVAVRGGSGGSKQKGKSAAPKKKRGRDGKAAPGGRAAPGFYELNDEEDAATAAIGLGSARDKQAQAHRRRYVCVCVCVCVCVRVSATRVLVFDGGCVKAMACELPNELLRGRWNRREQDGGETLSSTEVVRGKMRRGPD